MSRDTAWFGASVEVLPEAELRGIDRRLRLLAAFCFSFLKARLPRRWIMVTSGIRADGIHATGRALDFDVQGLDERAPDVLEALLELKGAVELLWPYRSETGPHHAMVWDTDDRHRNHVHLQVPPKTDR
jgi:hypothetical protein